MERAASDLIDKPIITYDTGRRLATCQDLLVDPERNQVLALLVDKGAILASPKAVPYGHIKAVGANAIVVPQANVIYATDKDKELKRTFDHRTIRGMRVYGEGGDRLGTVDDMILDDTTGEILYYVVSGGALGDAMRGRRTIVPGEVLNMGRLVCYVPAATAARLEAAQDGPGAPPDQAAGRQVDAITGRPALRAVYGPDDQPIVEAGQVITPDAVNRAQATGRLPALLMAGGLADARPGLAGLGGQAGAGASRLRDEAQRLWDRLAHHSNRLAGEADRRMESSRVDRALGRPASRVVLDRQDNVILNTGDIITNAAVAQARQAGVLNILLELGLHPAAPAQHGRPEGALDRPRRPGREPARPGPCDPAAGRRAATARHRTRAARARPGRALLARAAARPRARPGGDAA